MKILLTKEEFIKLYDFGIYTKECPSFDVFKPKKSEH